jgi:CRISPR/Cas system-associated endoribonuclease Cas2
LIFICVLTRTDRVKLAAEIQEAIDQKADRVVIVDLGEENSHSWIPDFEIFGRQQIERPRRHVVV